VSSYTMTLKMKVDLVTVKLDPIEIRQPLGRIGVSQSL
jgi:hypothetical protein